MNYWGKNQILQGWGARLLSGGLGESFQSELGWKCNQLCAGQGSDWFLCYFLCSLYQGMPLHLIFPEPCRISAHLSAGKAIPYGFFLISRVAESLSKSLFLFRSPSHHTKQIYTAGGSSCYFHFPNLLLSLSLLSFVDKHPAFQTKGLKVLKLGYTKGKRIFWGEAMPVEYPPALCRVCSLLLRLFLQLSFVLCACGYSKKGDGKFLGWFLFLCECCCHKTDPSTLWFQSVITCKGIIGIFVHMYIVQ